MTVKGRNTAAASLCILFAAALLSMPELCSRAALGALLICGTKIIPSVFPFAVLGQIFISCGGADMLTIPLGALYRKLFHTDPRASAALLLGALCGYPSGAVCLSGLVRGGDLGKEEAERLCGVCTCASPAFLIGAVGAGLLGDVRAGYVLCLSQLISAAEVGLLFRGRGTVETAAPSRVSRCVDLWDSVVGAVGESSVLCLKICGFTVFSEVLCSVLLRLFDSFSVPVPLCAAVFGAAELSFAVQYASSAFHSRRLLMILVSAFVGWSGMSVHMQVKAAVGDVFPLKKYFAAKALQAPLSALATYILTFFL